MLQNRSLGIASPRGPAWGLLWVEDPDSPLPVGGSTAKTQSALRHSDRDGAKKIEPTSTSNNNTGTHDRPQGNGSGPLLPLA